jgi:hypothetical protein
VIDYNNARWKPEITLHISSPIIKGNQVTLHILPNCELQSVTMVSNLAPMIASPYRHQARRGSRLRNSETVFVCRYPKNFLSPWLSYRLKSPFNPLPSRYRMRKRPGRTADQSPSYISCLWMHGSMSPLHNIFIDVVLSTETNSLLLL